MACWLLAGRCLSEEPLTLANVTEPAPNRADEPLAEQFSLQRAARFLDQASLQWQKQRACFTCHTNYAYLMARPMVSADVPAHREVRAFAEELVTQRWQEKGPRWDTEVVATAAFLAFNDMLTTGRLHEVTRQALDRTWTVQREDGGFNWLKCNWPPMESDDYYGAVLAALAVGVAPPEYRQTPAAQAGIKKLYDYLAKTPPPNLHHQAMLLWAGTYLPDLTTPQQREKTVEALLALQHADGGWSAASLGDWRRADEKEQDADTSDGYGTGFVVYVLRRAGLAADDPRIAKGVAWLKANQRASGRWFARSLNRDNHHFLSHAATAFAVMALCECGHTAGAE